MAEEKPKPAKPVKKAVAKAAPAKKPATAKAATPRAAAKPKPVEKAPKATGPTTTATQSLKDGAAKLTQEATGKARAYAEDGKARVGGVLDELSRMMGDAAGTVDEKIGAQYGDYARNAAEAVSGFSESLKSKQVDDIVADARAFVKKSPAIAIGAAAAIGFVLVRLIKSGLDSDDRA